MGIKQGDRVKFLNDVGEGRVTAILDKRTVMVSTEDGFDIPVLVSDLVRIDEETGIENRKIEHKTESKEFRQEVEKADEETPIDDEVVLIMRIKNNSEILPFLFNMSTYNLYYTLSRKQEGEQVFIHGGRLEPETRINLPRIVTLNMEEPVILNIQVLFFNESFFQSIQPVNRKIEFLPSDLFSGMILEENDYFEQKAAVFPVYLFREKAEKFSNTIVEGDLKKVLEEKIVEKKPEQKKEKPPRQDILEVDLHIENIIDEYRDLSNGEILEIQMSRFRTSLETAIIHKNRRVVFIHGVGNGKLKYELRKALDNEYPDMKYQDASFREYGYGATMVFIKV